MLKSALPYPGNALFVFCEDNLNQGVYRIFCLPYARTCFCLKQNTEAIINNTIAGNANRAVRTKQAHPIIPKI